MRQSHETAHTPPGTREKGMGTQGPPSAAASAGSSQSHAASDARSASQASTSSCVSHLCGSATPAEAMFPSEQRTDGVSD